MELYLILLVVLLLCFVSLRLGAKSRYDPFIKLNEKDFKLGFMAPAALYFLDISRLQERLAGWNLKVHSKIVMLHGAKHAHAQLRIFFAESISLSIIIMVFATVVPMLAVVNPGIVAMGYTIALLLPMLLARDLDKKIKVRKQEITMELPEFLSKMTLLVNAGETVQHALTRCVERKGGDPNPLYIELRQVVQEIENRNSFDQAMEDFSKRCAMQEVSVFTTTVLLNYKRGGGEFILALREISHELWEKRKAISRVRGEEASSKMVFPMVFIFLIVMVLVAAPAIMMMK